MGLIDKGDAVDDNYLNGLKTLNETVKIVDPEWNDWLAENQHLFGPIGKLILCFSTVLYIEQILCLKFVLKILITVWFHILLFFWNSRYSLSFNRFLITHS